MCWWLMQPWGGIKGYPSKCSLSPHTAIKKNPTLTKRSECMCAPVAFSTSHERQVEGLKWAASEFLLVQPKGRRWRTPATHPSFALWYRKAGD